VWIFAFACPSEERDRVQRHNLCKLPGGQGAFNSRDMGRTRYGRFSCEDVQPRSYCARASRACNLRGGFAESSGDNR